MIRVTYTRSLTMVPLTMLLLTRPAAAAPDGGTPAGGAQRTAVTASQGPVILAVPALTCAFAKMHAALKASAALNACFRVALVSGTAPDPACLDAADRKFRATFEKIEARGGCGATGDAPGVGHLVDQCAVQLVETLAGECLPAGSTCGGGVLTPCCSGLTCEAIIGGAATCR